MLSYGGDLRWRWPLGKPSPERVHSVTFRREMLLLGFRASGIFNSGGSKE
jgi:hypothetical protein